jgi:hypothetical protein
MKVFNIYYSGVIPIKAGTEEWAREIFERNYFDYGDIDNIKDVTEDVTKEWVIGKRILDKKYLTTK